MKLLVVTSSVRSGRAADNILDQVKKELENYDFDVKVADLKQLPLPFFDSPHIPAQEDFSPDNENVIKWTKMVSEADKVLILAAEYNHSYTPVLKNAIDWIYKEWKDKPVAFIGYGWAGGAKSIRHLRDVMNSNIAAKPIDIEANLRFTKEIDLAGQAISDDSGKQINMVLTSL